MTRLPSLAVALGLTLLAAAACSSSEDDPAGAGEDAPLPADAPTFKKDVEPLLQAKCQSCHREGGAAPFSLVTYEQAKQSGPSARVKVETRTMPPWGAFDSEACKMQHAFKDDLRLTDAQIAMFARWVDLGMPLGDASIQNPTPAFPSSSLETKTATLQMAAPFEVQGNAPDDIRCFPIDPGFTEDTWVSGVNVVPGNAKVVHHAIVFIDPKNESSAKVGADGSYECFGGVGLSETQLLMAWAPGARPIRYEDAAIKVKAGSKLVMQVHYHPGSESQKDQTGFELEVRKDKPANVAQLLLLGNAQSDTGLIKLLPGPNDRGAGPEFRIPANAKDHTETMELVLPQTLGGFPLPEMSIATVGAHMHWAGVDMKMEIERRAGMAPEKECLLGTPKYDFNWQRGYVIDAPLPSLPTFGPGDKLRITCTYDNTTGNPHVRRALAETRQSAPVDITLGESTLDEMCLGVLAVVRPATIQD